MLFEIASSASMLAVVGGTYFYQNKNSNDHAKIQKIADSSGLFVRENKVKKGIRIYRKTRKENYTEYVYKIPLGLSFNDFEEKKQLFIDGLNNKSQSDFNLSNLKSINWKKDVLKQIRNIANNRIKLDKHIEMEYDGMLKFRVYDKGLETMYPYSDEMMESVKGWKVPVGYTLDKLMTHDFEKRPHMIVAGATGFGKSDFLKLLISVLVKNQPDKVRLNLIDLKGGSELGTFKGLKQTNNFGRSTKEAKRILENIQKDMEKKLDWLFENGIKDIKRAGQKERDFIVIDEAASLDDESRDIVVDIARRGRSAGYRLIYATQYPTNETLPSQVRANVGVRLCFRLETNVQSRAVLDEGGAEEIPEIEGRAIFRRVKNHTTQTPYIKEKDIERIIKPHIMIRSKGEHHVKGEHHGSEQGKENGEGRTDTLILEKA
ncbi:FtsK/SpoIIIE domain-containing protein [Halobacillus sp. Marseille-P3879]|uniref:FtsK/SpoIIIE domain-containing protein n=1 Tax=Halobacillus sp. Marseille-P3879 TaxID=2045014 RepID=UPI001F373270|nr:FtsK/SpoIIIE domain-containing protein [Halobacillus sp. Marseille-P3879]